MKKKAIFIGCSLATVILIVIGCVCTLGKPDKSDEHGETGTQEVTSVADSASDDLRTPDTPELSLEDDTPVNSDETSEPTNKQEEKQPEQTKRKAVSEEGDDQTDRKEPAEVSTEATESTSQTTTEEPADSEDLNELPFVPFE